MNTNTLGENLFGWILVALGVVAFYWTFFPEESRRILYSIEYDVPSERVIVQPRPKDCDFFEVPYGSKGCDYEVAVQSYSEYGKKSVSVYWVRKGHP